MDNCNNVTINCNNAIINCNNAIIHYLFKEYYVIITLCWQAGGVYRDMARWGAGPVSDGLMVRDGGIN